MEKDIPKTYLRIAHQFAETSPDPSTQNGAILVQTDAAGLDHVIGGGANEFPRGVKYTPERFERPLKYSYIEHAERNSILDAARRGNSTDGSTMYVLWAACADCARAIIQAGVKRVVTHAFYHTQDNSTTTGGRKDWSASIDPAFTMLREAGVEIVFFDESLGSPNTVRFNGQPISL